MLLFLVYLYLRLRFIKNRLLTLLWTSISLLAPDCVINLMQRGSRFRSILVEGRRMQIQRIICYDNVSKEVTQNDVRRLGTYLSCFDWELHDLSNMCGFVFGDENTRQFVVHLAEAGQQAYILHVNMGATPSSGKHACKIQYQLLKPGEALGSWREPMFGKVQYFPATPAVSDVSLEELEALMNGT